MIKNWTDEDYCLKKVKEAGENLMFVINQTPQIIKEALNQNIKFKEYID